ncbi:MAG TPA: hypothetical protein VEF76_12530 [Patescibacteria group bacterium]|nr:hypothetical protein [Patescibacteria group bacterium]
MTALWLVLLGSGALGLACYIAYHAGRSDQKVKELEVEKTNTGRAAGIRDRLRRDAAYAARVRARFTR